MENSAVLLKSEQKYQNYYILMRYSDRCRRKLVRIMYFNIKLECYFPIWVGSSVLNVKETMVLSDRK